MQIRCRGTGQSDVGVLVLRRTSHWQMPEGSCTPLVPPAWVQGSAQLGRGVLQTCACRR